MFIQGTNLEEFRSDQRSMGINNTSAHVSTEINPSLKKDNPIKIHSSSQTLLLKSPP
jgi:hypothetical protein